jgi:hypothetical protein
MDNVQNCDSYMCVLFPIQLFWWCTARVWKALRFDSCCDVYYRAGGCTELVRDVLLAIQSLLIVVVSARRRARNGTRRNSSRRGIVRLEH